MNNDKIESIRDKLRRWADESENDNRRHIYPTFNAYDDLCIEVREDDCTSERKLFRRIADEIDAEKQSTLRNCAYPLTQEVGKPLKGDEDFKSWLDRYYLPRPLFDDGEPVQFGDRFVNDSGRNDTLSSLNYTKGDHDYVSANGGQRHKVTSRLKCPEPQVLDTDGVPIEIGDKVWLVPGEHCDIYPLNGYEAGVEYKVNENNSPNHKPNGRICITGGDCIYGYPMPEQVIHREPDTQERIDRDALKSYYEYWGCDGVCSRCPARIDDEKPHDRYDTSPSCTSAMTIDLLHRQRELDGRDA